MPVVAVINRKGGSGKSTLATQLAGHCANAGLRVMLGDVDRQQSSLGWLRRRGAQKLTSAAPIVGWAVGTKSVMRPPAGITHAVLDTPGGLHGFDLARVVMSADAILMPVADSIFDRESAAECYAELMTLPRVSSGRCKVGIVGMRLDARTKGASRIQAWAEQAGLPYIGLVRESQLYPRGAEQGLTVFDLPPEKFAADRTQWQPIIDWVHAAWQAAERCDTSTRAPLSEQPEEPAEQTLPQPARRPHVRVAMPAPRAVSVDLRPSLEAVHGRHAPRLNWLFTVFRPRS